ncbi:hypothetical protein LINPERHAP1_LOCUS8366 [Linum perenne]
MASAESVPMLSAHDDDDDDDDPNTEDAYDFHSHLNSHNNLSRLSVCTTSVSRLSIDSYHADEDIKPPGQNSNLGPTLDLVCSSDDDSEKDQGCYSLPATPPMWRNRGGGMLRGAATEVLVRKEYGSENEVGSDAVTRQKTRRRSFSINRENGGGMVVITRPRGGRRSLCMDMGEVKACRDLGFELEHERMVELPGPVSGTSSGSDSPVSNCRISNPGDDPRDVKERLKEWAHAVAMASAPTTTK